MSLPRLRLDRCLRTPSGLWILSPEEMHHLVRVRRRGEGDLVEGLLPGWKVTLKLRLEEDLWMGEELSRSSEKGSPLRMVLLIALLKGDAFEQTLRQATELGVHRICPLVCERSIPRMDASRTARKMVRWRKILEESTKQCGRTLPPELEDPRSPGELESLDLPEQRLAAIIDGEARPLGALALEPSLAYAVGPEGDFSPGEKALFREEGFASISLGSRILKAGTAAAAGLAYLSLAYEGTLSP